MISNVSKIQIKNGHVNALRQFLNVKISDDTIQTQIKVCVFGDSGARTHTRGWILFSQFFLNTGETAFSVDSPLWVSKNLMKFAGDAAMLKAVTKGTFVDIGNGVGIKENIVPNIASKNGERLVSLSVPDTKKPSRNKKIIPRDLIPSSKLQKVHGHLADKTDNVNEAEKARGEMQQMKTTIKRRGNNYYRVKIIQKARQLMVKCKKNGLEQLVSNFKDIELSWADDHSDANAEKLWQALFGQFDTEKNKPSHQELAARHVMSKLHLKYDQEEAEDWKATQRKPGAKGPSSCVETLMSECKGHIVRLACRPGRMIHGHSLVCVASKKAKIEHNLPKRWCRENGTFHPFFKTFTPSKITQDEKKVKLLERMQISSKTDTEWSDNEDEDGPQGTNCGDMQEDHPLDASCDTHTLSNSSESSVFNRPFNSVDDDDSFEIGSTSSSSNSDHPTDITIAQDTAGQFSTQRKFMPWNGATGSLTDQQMEIERLKKKLALAESQNEKKDKQLSKVMCPLNLLNSCKPLPLSSLTVSLSHTVFLFD